MTDSSNFKHLYNENNQSSISNCVKKTIGTFYEFYLSGEILEPEEYIDWFTSIREAGELDEIKININSPGGNLDTAIQFMRVLGESPAHIITNVEGSCMSAATIIFLCGDEFEITPHSLFMFHNYSSGMFGKGGELYDQAVWERKWSTNFFNFIYKNFLSDEEIISLLNNKDLWFHSDEVNERIQKLVATRQKEIDEANSISEE